MKEATFFNRFLLPGLAFKALVIGGGYATGRELAEFFVPLGAWGGMASMLVAMLCWSVLCALAFTLAWQWQAFDYRSFYRSLLGRGWFVFEFVYFLQVIIVLSVFGAAAGEIAQTLAGIRPIFGTVALLVATALVVAFGNKSVESVFKYVSIVLYGVYAVCVVLALATFGDRIGLAFAEPANFGSQWMGNGLTYASYNVIGVIAVLPVVRHMTSKRDAVIAGVVAGPFAMLPAILFFLAMTAFIPEIGSAPLPSDIVLGALNLPWFKFLFQIMVFLALLESGAGMVHAINERFDKALENGMNTRSRAIVSAILLVACVFIADWIGLVSLIANGYRLLAWAMLGVLVIPLLTIGFWHLLAGRPSTVDLRATN